MKNLALAIAFSSILSVGAQTLPVVVPTNAQCATSVDGSVVGVQNPLHPPQLSAVYSGGTLGPGNFYVVEAWYDAAAAKTLVGPEVQFQMTAPGVLHVSPPVTGMPSTAAGAAIYIGTSSGAETLQGTTVGNAVFAQSAALVTGAAIPSTNATVCQIIANDAGWPTGTGYGVTLVSPNGSSLPGYPMQWQLLGPGNTINLSQGLPMYNGTVTFPIPILARPYNHAIQSISGPLSMTGYALTQILRLGVGTQTPAWGIDVEGTGLNGRINAKGGYLVNGSAGTAGQGLCSDGTALDQLCNFIPVGTAIYYQTLQTNGTDQTQRLKLNFSSNFTLSDSASPSRTNADLSSTGISAGACNQPTSITFDAKGRASACSSGGSATPVARTCSGTYPTWSCYKVEADGTVTAWGVVPAATAGTNVTTGTITFPNSGANAFAVNPSLTISAGDVPDTGDHGQSIYFTGLSVSGATVQLRCTVDIGGGGCTTYANAVPIHWQAIGNN